MIRFRVWRARATVLLVALAAPAAGVTAAPALGDADPASDILLGAPVFYPFQPPVTQALQNQLQAELSTLQKQGLNLKVAIIETPVDLGAIPNLFAKPQTYADFLDQEISFSGPQPLLVVMPQGFGLVHAGSPVALAGLKVNAVGRSNGLAQSAIVAVQRIAKAAGKSTSPAGGTGAHSGSGGSSLLLPVGIPVVLVLVALGIIWTRRGGDSGTPEPRAARRR